MKFTIENIMKYAIGRQTDIAIAIEAAGVPKTSASTFLSLSNFTPQNAPEPVMFPDATGNRSSNTASEVGERSYPFSFAGMTDLNKIAKLIYLVMGEVVSVQDGATGAWQHTFLPINNVILPTATIFFSLGAEGYRRLTGVTITSLTVSITEKEASFSGTALCISEDDVPNSTTQITPLTVTDITRQSNGLVRYRFSGSPNLSTATNGDVLDMSAGSGIANSQHKGKFIVVNVNNTTKYVEVINQLVTDGTLDETGITGTGGVIKLVVVPNYPEPEAIMLRRHSSVIVGAEASDLDTAAEDGLSKFTFAINNNAMEVREGIRTANPSVIVSKNITVNLTFNQLITDKRAKKASDLRDSVVKVQAYRILLKDDSKFLGSSNSYHPEIRMDVPTGKGIATRAGFQGNDNIAYDWTVHAFNEQSVTIRLRNTISDTGLVA